MPLYLENNTGRKRFQRSSLINTADARSQTKYLVWDVAREYEVYSLGRGHDRSNLSFNITAHSTDELGLHYI